MRGYFRHEQLFQRLTVSLLLLSLNACDRFMDYEWQMHPVEQPSRACVIRALQEDGATPTSGSSYPPMNPDDIHIVEGRDFAIAEGPNPQLSIFDRRIQFRYSADTEAKIIRMFEQLEKDIAAKCHLTIARPSVYRCGGCPEG